MNIPLTVTVFEQILFKAAAIFKNQFETNHADILTRRKERLEKDEDYHFSPDSLWETNIDIKGSTFWSIGNSEGLNVCFDLFKVNHLYFYRILKEKFYDQGNTVADIRKGSLVSITRRFGFTDDEAFFFSYFISYIKAMPISSIDQTQQIEMIRQARKIGEDPILRNREIIKWNLETLRKNFKVRLASTKWYLYFYGYSIDGDIVDDSNRWQIARLILEFDESIGKELNVWIENTENPDHYDYYGKTDFSESTEKVLVLNLRTYRKNFPATRQLNIKLFVDGAEGSLFFGQYLNYEVNSGRIFSGDLIIEQTKTQQVERVNDEEKIRPLVSYVFTGSKDELNRDLGEHLKEIEHIIPFFKDYKSVFRETKTTLYTVRLTNGTQEVVPITDTIKESLTN